MASDTRIYVAPYSTPAFIVSMKFDGSDQRNFAPSGFIAHAMDLDMVNAFLYWGNKDSHTINRCSLHGCTSVETLLTGWTVDHIAVDLPYIYFTVSSTVYRFDPANPSETVANFQSINGQYYFRKGE